MSLIEQDAIRMAAALEDYEHVSVRAINALDSGLFEIEAREERFNCHWVIRSHYGYWEFIDYLVNGSRWPVTPMRVVA